MIKKPNPYQLSYTYSFVNEEYSLKDPPYVIIIHSSWQYLLLPVSGIFKTHIRYIYCSTPLFSFTSLFIHSSTYFILFYFIVIIIIFYIEKRFSESKCSRIQGELPVLPFPKNKRILSIQTIVYVSPTFCVFEYPLVYLAARLSICQLSLCI